MKLVTAYKRFKKAEEAQNDLAEGVVRNVIANKCRVPPGLFNMAKRANRARAYWKARADLAKALAGLK